MPDILHRFCFADSKYAIIFCKERNTVVKKLNQRLKKIRT